MAEISPYECKAMTYLQLNELYTTWKYAKKYYKLLNTPEFDIGFLGYLSALRGDRKNVEENLVGLTKISKENLEQDLLIDFDFIYLGKDEFDAAFTYLNEAVDKKVKAIVFLDTFVPLHPLVNDPRFQSFRHRIGLPSINAAAA